MSKKDLDSEKEVELKSDKTEKKAKKQKKDKNKKPNFFVRIGRKLKETFSELKRVTWPTFGKAVKATGVVIVIVLIFLVLVTGVNFGLSKILEVMTSWGNTEESSKIGAEVIKFITTRGI